MPKSGKRKEWAEIREHVCENLKSFSWCGAPRTAIFSGRVNRARLPSDSYDLLPISYRLCVFDTMLLVGIH